MPLNKKNFIIAAGLSFTVALLLLISSFSIGKHKLFLALNFDGGKIVDLAFRYLTHFGDGLIWIPLFLFVIFVMKRKDVIPLLVSSFILSTLFTQLLKRFIFPGELRPIKAIDENSLIHIVEGVKVHSLNSLPSGHTATAFCVYLIFCLLIRKPWWVVIGFILAVIAGYSRIYLAQHFAVDVATGIIIASISIWLSLFFQEYLWKRKQLRAN
jgi:membrane-associated phospholipid phosphatase